MLGRPKKYLNETARNQAILLSKKKYSNKEWKCPKCRNHDYKIAGKYNHINTKKHIRREKTLD